jgi:ABC-type multidrug transport system ATPase subunit
MLRRFGLAQALMHDPDLLLLDEPTAGLDAVGVGLFSELLGEARARGAAVVISSHLLGDVYDRADQLCVLVEGAVAARGAPQELVQGARRVRLELEGADDDLLRSIDDLAQRSGARVVHRGPGGETLLEIYRAHGGAR